MPALTQPAALALTLAIEVPLVVWEVARGGGSPRRAALVALGANLATHPVAWHAHTAWAAPVLLVEAAVVAAEAVAFALLLRIGPLRAVLLSVGANALSYGAGLL